jgi:hypothetical protein
VGGFGVQLVWLDPALAPRLRRPRAWREIIDALQHDDDLELRDALGPGDAAEASRNAFEVLARAQPTPVDSLRRVLGEAVRPDGKLVTPLVVVNAELVVQLDPRRRLETAVSVVEPLAQAHPALRAAVDAIAIYAKRPEGVSGGAGALTRQLLGSVASHLRNNAEVHLEASIERVLLEQRAYDTRDVLGAPHARLTLQEAGAVVYLPLAAAQRLPLAGRVRARLIAELHPRCDDAEPAVVALRAAALAREVDLALLA